MSSINDRYSRYQVRSLQCPAWAGEVTAGRAPYFYDGLTFWRQKRSGKSRVLASWQTPSHGWRHAHDCACVLCRKQTESAASAA